MINEVHEEFTCPKCGSHYFGTSGADNWDDAVGYCHGDEEVRVRRRGCKFSWPRKEDDQYFGAVELNREQFQKVKQALGEAVYAICSNHEGDSREALWNIVDLLGGQEVHDLLNEDWQRAYEQYVTEENEVREEEE